MVYRGPEAIQVLLEHLESMERAVEFAAYWDQPNVWSLLGKAQLEKELVKVSKRGTSAHVELASTQSALQRAHVRFCSCVLVFLVCRSPSSPS